MTLHQVAKAQAKPDVAVSTAATAARRRPTLRASSSASVSAPARFRSLRVRLGRRLIDVAGVMSAGDCFAASPAGGGIGSPAPGKRNAGTTLPGPRPGPPPKAPQATGPSATAAPDGCSTPGMRESCPRMAKRSWTSPSRRRASSSSWLRASANCCHGELPPPTPASRAKRNSIRSSWSKITSTSSREGPRGEGSGPGCGISPGHGYDGASSAAPRTPIPASCWGSARGERRNSVTVTPHGPDGKGHTLSPALGERRKDSVATARASLEAYARCFATARVGVG
mmetsp:Transcript_135525/g.289856  ORF Transcript_135525/g.289856 Transcript_135525/m.289856 type:complete len:283 (-) Transcript_135525:508-1356(-)